MIEKKLNTYSSLDGRQFTYQQMSLLAIAIALEKKATRPTVLDMSHLGGFTEYFAVVSAANPRQVATIADDIVDFFKAHFALKPLSIDGLETSTWVLLDYGFLFVHIFQEATRENYKLEQLWNKAHLLALETTDMKALYTSFLPQQPETSY